MRSSVFSASLLPRAVLLGVAACCANPAAWGQAAVTRVNVISTVAGDNTYGCPTSGSLATSAPLNVPYGMAVDPAGDQFIADEGCNAVYKVAVGTNIITLVAGGNGSGSSGDGGLATAAELSGPSGVIVDSAGNVYIADTSNNRIRKVTAATGIITTIAGDGTYAYNGDNISAVSAEIGGPEGVGIDTAGNVYIADTGNNRIRKITVATGIITTVAGNGTGGYNGDGILATAAELNGPYGVAVDASGSLYLTDPSNYRIRKVNAGTGIITTLAGNGTPGYSGDNGPGTSAELNFPWGIALDPSGNVYFADLQTQTVREISASTGYILTVAGNNGLGQGYSGDGGLATSAQLSYPTGVAFDDLGNLYIDDYGNEVVRRVNPSGGTLLFPSTPVGSTSAADELVLRINTGSLTATSFSPLASQGAQQEYSVTSNSCALNTTLVNGTLCFLTLTFHPAYPGPRALPLHVATSSGNFNFGMFGVGAEPLVALTPGTITTGAGTGAAGYGGDGGPAASALFFEPAGIAIDYAGNQYISDYENHRIRRIDAVTGVVSTFVGTGTAGYSGDTGLAVNAEISGPAGLVLDPAGDLYFVDQIVHCVRRVDADTLLITTVAGNGTGGYSGDGNLATSAQLLNPVDLAIDTTGNIFIADTGNSVIREVNTAGIINTFAGNGTPGYSGDAGPAASAELNLPEGIIADGLGNLFVSDTGNQRIRKIDGTGTITTVAGDGTAGFSGDGGPATSAELHTPGDIKTDPAGNVYFTDIGNQRLRKVELASGLISTLAGNGTGGYSGDGGPSTGAELHTPGGLAMDVLGNLLLADSGNNVIRRVSVQSGALSFASTVFGATSSDSPQVANFSNIGNAALTFSVPSTGLNPSISSNFALGVSSTCPQLTTSSSPATLSEGLSCTLSLSFEPAGIGTFSGTVNITDNALNASSTVQTVAMNGVGTPVATTTTVAAGTPTYGQTVVTATIAPVTGSALAVGSVVFTVDGVAQAAVTVNGAGVATMTAAVSNALGGGAHTIGAAYTSSSVDLGNSSGSTSITVAPTQNVQTGAGGPATSTYGQPVTITASSTAGGIAQSGVLATVTVGSHTYTCTTDSLGACTVSVPGGVFQAGTDSYMVSTPATANAAAGSSSNGITVAPAPAVVTASVNPATPAYGQPATVTVTDTAAGVPQAGSTATVTVQGQMYTCTTNSGGQCTVSVPAGVLQGGNNTIMLGTGASANASAGTGSAVVAVTPAAAVVTASVSPATPAYGQPATVTVTAMAGGFPVNGSTGTVTFGGHSYTCTTNSSGQCSVVVPGGVLPGGNDTVAVATSATADAAAGSGAGSVTVTPVPPVVTADISPASPTYGQTATVTVTSTAAGIPQSGSMGTVTVGSHTYTCTTGLSGQCTVQVPGGVLQGGMNTVTVATGATANASVGSGSSTVTVAPAATMVTASVNPTTPVFGQPAIVTVTATAGGIPQAGSTGTVTVQGQMYTCTTNGLGQCTVSVPGGVLQGGNNTLTLATAATANGLAGTGSAVIAVTPAPAVVTATISPATPAYGQPATVTVTAMAGGSPLSGSTGTVTVEGHSYTCTTNSSGQCTVSVPAGVLQGGSDTVAVATSATANAAAGSSASSVTVTPVAPVVTASVVPASPTYGQAATLTVTSLAAGFPVSGSTATVSVAGQSYTCTTNSTGQCTVQVPGGAVQGGNDTVTVATGATANASAGSGSSVITVGPGMPVVTFSLSPAAPEYGQATTINVSVGAGSAFVPGSVLTLTVGGKTFTCTTNASGTCAITVPAGVLTAGSDAFSVSTGATSDAVAGSATGTVTVAMAPATLTLTSSAATVNEGAPVTFTATAVSATSGVPSGTVTFYFNGTAIGTGTLSGGVATLTLSTLPTGADAITAVYGGDVDFSTATAAAFTETVLVPSFTIAVAPGAPPAASVAPGGTATFPLSLGTINGFTGSLAMSATGLPPGATATFTPEDVVLSGPNAGITTLSIVTPLTPPAATAAIRYGWLLLPLFLLRLRRKARLFCCALLIPLAMLAGLTGCGGGYYGQSATSYVVTVTASNGVISHSTTVTLTVQ